MSSMVCSAGVGSSCTAWLESRLVRSACCQATCMPIHGRPVAAAVGLGGPAHMGPHQHNILQHEWLHQANVHSELHAVTQKQKTLLQLCKAASSSGDKFI